MSLSASKGNSFYLFCVSLSLILFVVRPGEFIPALSSAKLLPLSMALTCIGFLASGGLQTIQRGKFLGVKPVLLLLLLGFLTIVFSVWPGQAFKTWWSVLLVNSVLFFFWLPAGLHPSGLRRIVIVFALSSGCLVGAMLLKASFSPEAGRVIVAGSGYDPNDIALVLATTFPFLVFLFFSSGVKARLFWGTLLVGLMVALLKTGSRGGMLALAVACLLFLFVPSRRGIKAWYKILLVALVAIFFLSPAAETVNKRWQDVISGEDYNFTQTGKGGEAGRLSKWQSGANVFAENMVTGVGVGNAGTSLGLETGNWLTIHNSYLQVGMEMGLIGLVLFVLLLWSIWCSCTQALVFYEKKTGTEPLILLAACTRIALVTFIVGAFFLSQAYSIVIPILLVISNGLYRATNSPLAEEIPHG